MPDAAEMDHLRELAAGGPSPEKVAIVRHDMGRLMRAIQKVPPSYRIVLVLHDVEELSNEEIARILNLKEGNVRVRLHRARLFVRKELALAPTGAEKRVKPLASSALPRSRKCKQIFANLSEYLDGNLDGVLCEELERHMAGCTPCEAFLSSLRDTVTACMRCQARYRPHRWRRASVPAWPGSCSRRPWESSLVRAFRRAILFSAGFCNDCHSFAFFR